MSRFKKNDVIAIVHKATNSVRIVKVVSAPKNSDTIRDFRTYPGSPIRSYVGVDTMLFDIGGGMHDNARRLFEAATQDLDYSSQDEARNAISEVSLWHATE